MTFPHMSAALPQLASPADVAQYLGRTTTSVVRLCRKGELPGVKVGGRWMVHLAKLAAQLDESSLAPTPTEPSRLSDNSSASSSGSGDHRPSPPGGGAPVPVRDACRPPLSGGVAGVSASPGGSKSFKQERGAR